MGEAAKRPAPGAQPGEGGPQPQYEFQCALVGHERSVSSVKWAPARANPDENTRLLASTSADCTVKVWKIRRDPGGDWGQPELVHNFEGHEGGCNDVCWKPAGTHLCSASDDKKLKIWSLEAGECVATLEGHTNYVMSCHWHCDGLQIVSGSFDETVRIWDVHKRTMLRELPAHSDPVTATYFNKDGTMIVSSSFDGLCRTWRTQTGECVQSLLDARNPPVSHVCWTPNCKYLLASSLDGRLRLWDYQKRQVVKKYEGHVNEKFSVFAGFAQGAYVISGSEDHTIHIWPLIGKKTAQIIPAGDEDNKKVKGHLDKVLCVDTSEDLIASGSMEADPRVLIWRDKNPPKKGKKKQKKAGTTK